MGMYNSGASNLKTPFFFDKVYETVDQMDPNDEVFVGRYVYCQDNLTVYQKQYSLTSGAEYVKILTLTNEITGGGSIYWNIID